MERASLEHAFVLHQQGDLDAAERIYREVLTERPGEPDALHLLGLVAHQRGAHDEAVDWLERAVARRPEDAGFAYNLGIARLAAGRQAAGREALERAVALRASHADAHAALGNLHLAEGRHREAIEAYRRAVAHHPELPQAWNNLGSALQVVGQADDAVAAFRRAIAARPAFPEAWDNLAHVVQSAEGPGRAAAILRPLVDRHPGIGWGHLVLGAALEAQGEVDVAVAQYEQAVALDPGRARPRLALGLLLLRDGRSQAALAHLHQAVETAPEEANAWFLMGIALARLGFVTAAVQYLTRALEIEPGHRGALASRGTMWLGINELDEALADFEAAMEGDDPAMEAAGGLVGALDRLGREDEARQRIQEFLDRHGPEPDLVHAWAEVVRTDAERLQAIETIDRIIEGLEAPAPRRTLSFAQARLLDRVGRHDEAFARAARANALKNAHYDRTANRALVDRLMDVFAEDRLDRLPQGRVDDPTPVFIVGLPRSGTSLAEQILASHPDVYGAGELEHLMSLLVRLPQRVGDEAEYPEVLLHLDDEALEGVARAYLHRLREHAPSARRITDKMPSNHWHVGTILRALPSARIVHCVRDPLDVATSIWFLDFRGLHRYAYDLADLGHFIGDYRRLMDHWRTLAGDRMFDLRYEALVGDPEAQVRALLEFVGVPWDPRCLRFHETERLVGTASHQQVRQPLYRRSIGRWRPYADALAPLRAILDQGVTVTDTGSDTTSR